MTAINDPAYLQGGSHTAQGDRLVLASLVTVEGIVGSGSLAVTEKSGTPDMSVDVAAGSAFIAGTQASYQGTYHVTNDATVNLAVAAADATNPRIDLVVAKVEDAFYAGATNDWSLAVVTGTAAASPSEPAVPDNALVLARVDVAALSSSVTDSDITDRRDECSIPGGYRQTVRFTSSGTFTKADYPWARTARIQCVGAGAAGGGAASTTAGQGAVGAGGGAGGWSVRTVAVASLATSETVTVGAAGTGVSGAAGNAGGDTSFGTWCVAKGGTGGGTLAAASSDGRLLGGAGGTTGTAVGDHVVGGAPGQGASRFSGTPTAGGNGGSGPWGGGGIGTLAAGSAATGTGSGGGGGESFNGEAATAGGTGANGIVLVELFA